MRITCFKMVIEYDIERATTICIPEIFTPYFFKENIYGKG